MRLFHILDILVNPHPTLAVQQSDSECFNRGKGLDSVKQSGSASSQTVPNLPGTLYSPRSPKPSVSDRRTLRSYRHRQAAASDEDILNVTCSLDTDSLYLSQKEDQVLVETESSSNCRASTEYCYAGSMASRASCYSATSNQAGLQRFQFVDKRSGVVFETVSEGDHGFVSAQDICFANSMHGLDYTLAGSVSSSAHLVESLPILTLTMPTPVIPPSPVFVPQSPVTLCKFMAASDRFLDETASFSSQMPVPLVPECEGCCDVRRLRQQESYDGRVEPSEQQWFCRTCRRQWLACKVWYQACDGGRRQYLREPFIKPGESNASNRALMEMLGLPTVRKGYAEEKWGRLKGKVVGIRDIGDSVGAGMRIRKSVKRKLRRSLKRTFGRVTDGGGCVEVDEMGQIRSPHDRSLRILAPVSWCGTFWNSVKTALRRR